MGELTMIINTKGVELTPPAEWIKEPGKYTLKIIGWSHEGYNSDTSEKFKINFQDSDGRKHSELYSTASNMLWKIKRLEVALQAPELYELDSLIGRYVIATIGQRTYNEKTYAEAKEWEYCPLNDKLPPIAEPKSESEVIAEEAELAF